MPTSEANAISSGVLDFVAQGDFPDGSTAIAGEPGSRYVAVSNVLRYDERFQGFARNPYLVETAAALMPESKTIRLFFDQLFVVEPNSPTATHWHNDISYWPFEGNDILTIWLALSTVGSDASPVRYVAESHLDYAEYRPVRGANGDTPEEQAALRGFQECPDFDEADARHGRPLLVWSLEPGDALAHNAYTAHASAVNTSGAPRVAYAVRYLGDDIRYKPKPHVPIDRGILAEPGQYPADDVALPVVYSR